MSGIDNDPPREDFAREAKLLLALKLFQDLTSGEIRAAGGLTS